MVSGEGTLSELSIRGCHVFSFIEVSFGCEFVNLSPDEWARLHYMVKDLEMQPFQREALRCLVSRSFCQVHPLSRSAVLSSPVVSFQNEVYLGSEVPSLQFGAVRAAEKGMVSPARAVIASQDCSRSALVGLEPH